MSEWTFAQTDPSEELAQLHYFSMKKRQPGGDIEFLITVREYATIHEQGSASSLRRTSRRIKRRRRLRLAVGAARCSKPYQNASKPSISSPTKGRSPIRL